MTIGEFEDVGTTIKEFASENATVVVGTVIDPEMTDEIRVTVVATGLGAEKSAVEVKPQNKPVISVVESSNAGDAGFDKPTIIRRQAQAEEQANKNENLDYLDVPAFLRRQAD